MNNFLTKVPFTVVTYLHIYIVAKYINEAQKVVPNVAQRVEMISLFCLFDLGGWTLDTGHFFHISPTQCLVF
jgi:hypothetical protein